MPLVADNHRATPKNNIGYTVLYLASQIENDKQRQ